MASFSKVILMGNATRDPEIRFTQSGAPVAGFGIGINRRFKGKDGSLKDETCFVDITFFGKQADICQKYVHKGNSIIIEGRLKQDTWEGKDGQKRSKLVVIGERLHLMPKKSDKETEPTAEVISDEPMDDYQPVIKPSNKKKDSEIPF